ncbi:3-keto-5-aminohexanoate cleavage protein [Nocardioides sp. WG-D5]
MTLPHDRVIVTIAPTGGFLTREHHPHVPVQPIEIAEDVARCVDAGASVAALHARRPDGQATCSAAIYRDINTRVRSLRDVIVNNSTGGGINGDLLFETDQGTHAIDWAARLEGLDGGADTCTLDAVTAYITGPDGREVLMDTSTARARQLADGMRARGIKPEWEAFSPTHLIREVARLTDAGMDAAPHIINLVLGLDATFQNALPWGSQHLRSMLDVVPTNSVVGVSINGPDQMVGLAHALTLGLNVRVGIEDHGLLHGEPAENVRLVEHVVSIIEALGLTPATPAEARAALGLDEEVPRA